MSFTAVHTMKYCMKSTRTIGKWYLVLVSHGQKCLFLQKAKFVLKSCRPLSFCTLRVIYTGWFNYLWKFFLVLKALSLKIILRQECRYKNEKNHEFFSSLLYQVTVSNNFFLCLSEGKFYQEKIEPSTSLIQLIFSEI